MSSILWKINRLQAMGVAEIYYRVRQSIGVKFEKYGIGLAVAIVPNGKAESVAWCNFMSYEFDRTLYIDAAEKILAGFFDVFALHGVKLGFPPQWNRDCRTGTVAPLKFGKSLNYRDEKLVGDIKYLWEPNRHLEMVTLSQAYHLTGELRYALGIRVLLLSWFDQCPYPLGPNWSSSLEHSVRLVNWTFVWYLLGGEASPLFQDVEGQAFRGRWLEMIYQHCHFIANHFSRYSSANNHLLGEYMGLFVAATTWPLWKESTHWRSLAQNGFMAEALKQNFADGVNREQAIWYHHEVADMMILCGLIGRANGLEFSAEYWSRLESMLEFVFSLLDVGSNLPMFGDSDDAVMVRFSPEPGFNVFKSLLATGALLFRRGDFKRKAGGLDDKSRWLFGNSAVTEYENIASSDVLRTCREFPQGGYYVLGSHFDCLEEVRIVADCAPLGYLSIAAHGHADALSLTLSVAGLEVFIDPGTYAYHTQQMWRDYFRSTSAHNTVCVDGLDQSVIAGNFMWNKHAKVSLEAWETGEEFDRLVGSHNGYLRLNDPVLHRREIKFFKELRELVVKDVLECTERHYVEIHWHCHEDAEVFLQFNVVKIVRKNLEIKLCFNDHRFSVRLAKGEESPPLGWISRQFDSKVQTTTIVLFGYIEGGCILETKILIN